MNSVSGIAGDGILSVSSDSSEVTDWAAAHLLNRSLDYQATGWHGRLEAETNAALLRDIALTVGERSRSARLYDQAHYRVGRYHGQPVYVIPAPVGDTPEHAVLWQSPDEVRVVGVDGDQWRRVPLRVLRDVVRAPLLDQGGILVHSAAVTTATSGVLFVGASGAGKTTSALRCAALGAYLVTTDRTLLQLRDGRVRAIGGPDIVRIGMGAAGELGILPAPGLSLRQQPSADELAGTGARFASRTKIEAGIAEIDRSHGYSVSDAGQIRIVAVVRHTDGPPSVRKVDVDEVWPDLVGEILHPDPRHGHPFASHMVDFHAASRTLRGMCETLQAVCLEWNQSEPEANRATYRKLLES